jgi:uncharacterized protein (TIGR03000 family)
MLHKGIWAAGIAALTAALVMFSASPVMAQRGGHGGGGFHGGAAHVGAVHAGAAHVGVARGYYGGGYRGYGYGGYGYGRGYYGGAYLGLGYGYPYYGGYPYYYGPSYYSDYVYPSDTSIYTTPPYTSSYYSPPATGAPASYDSTSDALRATIAIHVPPNAQVWFDGAPTTQTGEMRQFVSPPLDTGRTFNYEVRAQWMDNGKTVDQTRRVQVRAGSLTSVDFLKPAPSNLPSPNPVTPIP